MGYLDKFQKLINEKGKPEHRIFIQYNEIVSADGKDQKTVLKNVIIPIPLIFKSNYHVARILQRAYSLVKYLSLQRIYKNNYAKHIELDHKTHSL